MIKLKHLRKQHADNGAMLVGAILELLVLLKVPEHLNLQLSQDEVIQVCGLLIFIAGASRSIFRSRKAEKSEKPEQGDTKP